MECNDKWNSYPFPYIVIDNFLPLHQFEQLSEELDSFSNAVQCTFKSSLERKTIYHNTPVKNYAQELIDLMGSTRIKGLISQRIGEIDILSLSETKDYSGYSPFHITENNGFLGSHVDHSYIQAGTYRHIANSIFYASNSWQEGWGGHTIFFSSNGLLQKTLIEPIPNRLVLFIHTANSFHGVSKYLSANNIKRRTFYHDYYVHESDILLAMENLNCNRKSKLKHTFHTTTFIPSIPFGLNYFNFSSFLHKSNLKYLPQYLIYLFNYLFGTRIVSVRSLFAPFKIKMK